MSNYDRPRTSPGMQEMLDAMYRMSGETDRPSFLSKLFAPIPMEAELCGAGLEPTEARIIAQQLDRNGYVIVSKAQSHKPNEGQRDE